MNEWIMAGVVIGGTVLALGGGSFILNVLRGGKKDTKA
jgi:hypothetical protein